MVREKASPHRRPRPEGGEAALQPADWPDKGPPITLTWDRDARIPSQAGAPPAAADSPGPAPQEHPEAIVHRGAPSDPARRPCAATGRESGQTASKSGVRRGRRPCPTSTTPCWGRHQSQPPARPLRGLRSWPARCRLTGTRAERIWSPLPLPRGEADGIVGKEPSVRSPACSLASQYRGPRVSEGGRLGLPSLRMDPRPVCGLLWAPRSPVCFPICLGSRLCGQG